MRGKTWNWQHLRHVIAGLTGFLAFALIYSATGDRELLIAISIGLAVTLLVYLGAFLPAGAQDRTAVKRIVADLARGTIFLAVLPAMFGLILYILYLVSRTDRPFP